MITLDEMMAKKKAKKVWIKILVIMLFLDALLVFVGKCFKADMWIPIAAYWFILTVKNFVDWKL